MFSFCYLASQNQIFDPECKIGCSLAVFARILPLKFIFNNIGGVHLYTVVVQCCCS